MIRFRQKLNQILHLPILRHFTQVAFALFLLIVGWQFYGFVRYFETLGQSEYYNRPPVVEAFLPISALVGLKSWLSNGIFDQVHPAGLVLLLTIVGVAFLFRKAFCSWICPIGALFEATSKLGKLIMGKSRRLPFWLDYPLMSLKYILLAFFVKFVLIDMPGQAALAFTQSPYNMISDVKMMNFFFNLSSTGLIVIFCLFLGSFFLHSFWCRYLCPYGALLGLVSWLSPMYVARNKELCIDCGKCDKVCPNSIQVSCKDKVLSPECTACLNCISSCPKHKALEIRLLGWVFLKDWRFPLLLVMVFVIVSTIAKFTGNWYTQVPEEMFRILIPRADEFNH